MNRYIILIPLIYFFHSTIFSQSEAVEKAATKIEAGDDLTEVLEEFIIKYDQEKIGALEAKLIKDSKELKAFKFVGGGDFNSIVQNEEDNINTANLSLGLYLRREFNQGQTNLINDIEVDFGINIASTAEYIDGSTTRDFGSYILNPINTSQSARLDLYMMFKNKRNDPKNLGEPLGFRPVDLIEGAYFRFYGGNAFWNNGVDSIDASGYSAKFGILHEFLPNVIAAKNNVSVMLGIGYAFRWVGGDVVQDNEVNLPDFLGTNRSGYNGFEFLFGVKFGNIRAEFLLPLIKGGDDQVLGLTNNQFLTTIRFVGGFDIDYGKNEERFRPTNL